MCLSATAAQRLGRCQQIGRLRLACGSTSQPCTRCMPSRSKMATCTTVADVVRSQQAASWKPVSTSYRHTSSVNSKLRMSVNLTLTSSPVVSLGRKEMLSATFWCTFALYSSLSWLAAIFWSLLESSRCPATREIRRSCSSGIESLNTSKQQPQRAASPSACLADVRWTERQGDLVA